VFTVRCFKYQISQTGTRHGSNIMKCKPRFSMPDRHSSPRATGRTSHNEHWAYRPADHLQGESLVCVIYLSRYDSDPTQPVFRAWVGPNIDAVSPIEFESSNLYDRSTASPTVPLPPPSHSAATYPAHLVNQGITHKLIALQILVALLANE
jgi:hypothetical protein